MKRKYDTTTDLNNENSVKRINSYLDILVQPDLPESVKEQTEADLAYEIQLMKMMLAASNNLHLFEAFLQQAELQNSSKVESVIVEEKTQMPAAFTNCVINLNVNIQESNYFGSNFFKSKPLVLTDCELFLKAFSAIIKPQNMLFQANVLSILADYLLVHKKDNILRHSMSILMAYTLYQKAILLKPFHPMAHSKIKMIESEYKNIVKKSKEFNHNDLKMDCPVDFYNNAIEDLSIELDTFLSLNPSMLKNLLGCLVSHVATEIETKNLDTTHTASSQLKRIFFNEVEDQLDTGLSY